MGSRSSTTTSVVPPTLPTQPTIIKTPAENSTLQELLFQIKEPDRLKVISYCPDLYTEENTSDFIATNPQLIVLMDYMREKIQDENPFCALGRLMLEMGSYDRAEYFYFKILSTEKDNWIRQAAVLNNLNKIYHDQDKHDQALEYYEKAVDLALEYFQRALKIEKNGTEPAEELIALFNNHIGSIYNDQKQFSQALISHEKCLQMNDKLLPSTHPFTYFSRLLGSI